MHPLLNLCQTADITKKSDIYISKHIANTTAWDTLAIAQPADPLFALSDQATTAAQVQHLIQYIDQDTVLLDYGCGYGRIATQLLPVVSMAGYIGLDSSHEMLKLFRERVDHFDSDPATPLLLLNADINNPPLQTNTIDLVVATAVFRHNHKSVVKQAVHELARVVRPGGRVLVYRAFPRVWTLMGLQGQLYQIALNLLGRPFKNGPDRYYTQGEVRRLFVDFSSIELIPAGFAVIPPKLCVLPRPLQILWQRYIATPINTILHKLTPTALQHHFATHIDVVAKR